MARHYASWIEGFMEFTSRLPSPELFRRWTAVSAISGALERKVWVIPTSNLILYPNTYILLVGPPGAGKTVITSRAQALWRKLPDHKLASSSLTKASLMDELNEAKRGILRPGENPGYIEFNYLSIISNELGVLIPAYDNDFMSVLTDIYDGYGYSERRRSTKIKFDLEKAQFNLLAGTTPSYLAGTLPPGAWDQGFLSRTIIVFSGSTERRPLFEDLTTSDSEFRALAEDLLEISKLFGRMKFTPSAADLISNWHMAGGPPIPDHPKLASYNERRTQHLFKLCMITSVSKRNDLLVTEEDFIESLDLMTLTESFIPDIFKAMNSGGDQRAIEDSWYYLMQTFGREKKPIAAHRLVQFLSERVPAYSVGKIIEVMTKAGVVEERLEPGVGVAYIPRPKR